MATAKRLLQFLMVYGGVALSALPFSIFCFPAQSTPGPSGQATVKESTVKIGKPESSPDEAKPQNPPSPAEKWLEAIETTYKHSQEDLANFIEIMHTVFEVLAVVLVIVGIVLGYDISKLHSQLREQHEAQKRLQAELDRKYVEVTTQLDEKFQKVQDKFQSQAHDIEVRLEQLVKNSSASVSAAQAFVLRMNAHFDESIQCWSEAITLNPTAYHFWQRAYTLEAKGKYPESIQDCDSALKLQPDHVEARALKGYLLIKTLRFADAVKELEAVLKTKGDDKYSRYNLAVAYGAVQERGKVLVELRLLKSNSELDEFLPNARTTPHFDFLRQDNDFKTLVN